ncbi:MAG: YhcH/YjgK/YiaL family protein, partial [Candidatus Gastranaerophilales bacterium]|nr:YhcH/YjgK/YiaL family protein [Candidatus Gastranaerophilales bacterium]
MIFDDFKNINLYGIDKEIADFILNINPRIEEGRYEINKIACINIDIYKTRKIPKPEAHKKHIDIQFLIKGREKVFVTDKTDLKESEKYNPEKDVTFFEIPKKEMNTILLTEGKFLLLYPTDVHAPCIQYDSAEETVK